MTPAANLADTPPRRKSPMRFLLLLLIAALFAASQDHYLMRRLLMRRGGHETVRWETSFSEATARAQREKRPVYLDFAAKWCEPCQEMLAETYKDGDVAHSLNTQFVPVLIDIDKQPELAAHYSVGLIPDGVFLSPDGRQIARSIGFHGPDEFLAIIDKAQASNAKLPPAPHQGFTLPPPAPPAPPLMP